MAVGSNQIMGGQTLKNKSTTDNAATFLPNNWVGNCPSSSYTHPMRYMGSIRVSSTYSRAVNHYENEHVMSHRIIMACKSFLKMCLVVRHLVHKMAIAQDGCL